MPVLFPQRAILTRRGATRLTEFNKCHEPGGSPEGGRFAQRGQGNCDGAANGGGTRGWASDEERATAVARRTSYRSRSNEPGTYGPFQQGRGRPAEPDDPSTMDRTAMMRSINAEEVLSGGGAFPQFLVDSMMEAIETNNQSFVEHGGKDSQQFYKTEDGGTRYTADRLALHQEIYNKLFTGVAPVAPGEPKKIVLMGGLPGAGKTFSVMSRMNTSGFVIINADDIKEMLPEYNGNNAAFLHEESSDLAKTALRLAANAGYNVIFDGTMSKVSSIEKTLAAYKGANYTIEARFVDVPLAHSMASAMARFYRGQQKNGHGRLVPASFIADAYDAQWGSAPRATFEALKAAGTFHAWEIVDGTAGGKTPKVLGSFGQLTEASRRRSVPMLVPAWVPEGYRPPASARAAHRPRR